MEKILTVSIAAYNVEQYIDKVLQSLMCSSMDRLEVLIIDDGSTDNTFSIAGEYESRYPDTFHVIHKENGGYGSTINHSIGIATGKYFKQLDADDWFDTDNLDGFIDYLEHNDSDLVLSPLFMCHSYDGHSELVDSHTQIDTKASRIEDVYIDERIMMHELSIKTSVLKDNDIRITENCFYTDNEYVFEPIIKSSTISRYDKPVYCYRVGVNGQSVSLESIKKHYTEIKRVAYKLYELYYAYLRSGSYTDKGKNNILKGHIRYVTIGMYSYYLATGKPEIFYNELKKIDKEIKKEYPEIYKMTFISKRVVFLRYSRFLLAPIISIRVTSEISSKYSRTED